jgi:hypothetical protein
MPIVNGTWLAILLLSTTPRRYCEHQLARHFDFWNFWKGTGLHLWLFQEEGT